MHCGARAPQLSRGVRRTLKMKIPKGIKVDDIVLGWGPVAEKGKFAMVHYDCFIRGGECIRSTRDCSASLGIQCTASCDRPHDPIQIEIGRRRKTVALEYGTLGMRAGGVRRLLVSPHLAYYERRGNRSIPADAFLDYQIRLIRVTNERDTDATRGPRRRSRLRRTTAG
jgi:FKBP-type peptidyl-prolyl cis-trans isomerase